MTVTHPAKFSASVLEAVEQVLDEREFTGYILDPFGGVGGIHDLWTNTRFTYSVELEPEWAFQRAGFCSMHGDATQLTFRDGSFDAVVTSPPYGNRMADSYAGDAKESRRHTYRIALGRPLTEGSAASLQWGTKYQAAMTQALSEMDRVLRPGGLVILNLSNHIRQGQLVPVCDWYLRQADALGLVLEDEVPVATPRNRHGANAELRDTNEWLFVMVKP